MTTTPSESSQHGITADLLIPGRGQPVPSATVIIKGSKIAWAGSSESLPSTYAKVPTRHVSYLLAGLWDCHVHFVGVTSLTTGAYFAATPVHTGIRLARDAAATLNAGFTSVRDVGGFGCEVAKAVKEGTIEGPNVYSSGSAIGMTGGHTDKHSIPLPVVQCVNAQGSPAELADGPDGAMRAVRLQLRKGARLIKICGTGGAGSLLDDPRHRQFSDAELKAFVEEAERAQLIVASHCHGKGGILACIKAGVRTIEHGSYLDDEVIDQMKERDVILVPTRSVFVAGLKLSELWEPESYEKLKAMADAHEKSYALAVKRGVKIALGTDLNMSNNSLLGHGRNGKELYYAVQAGMTPLQAIEACTATAPETLGLQAPMSGQVKERYDADLIAMEKNPLEDIDLISDPSNIKYVWKGGKLVKSPS
ncbi:hypothetical protein MMC18_003826 [Xylographa bjoerkii]|nr:hypothetical protein [Xylographa bjoerkii]